ncbi:DUF927 domain-containing protein [Gluconacetobacter diazotrophicus]|uniref:DUF927 domain-containing protein n=1 Tax=Gluconacetobacter diazotrophicus TaxID=33996 RepID=A0A7W4FBR2_GLUDI|nr:DUF927 domain-containing protein [Gluconacetobacter diazotrophicus]MBB2154830.1 DUF927 domain-containing protein [Gluconacetobacter diazotrophicus]
MSENNAVRIDRSGRLTANKWPRNDHDEGPDEDYMTQAEIIRFPELDYDPDRYASELRHDADDKAASAPRRLTAGRSAHGGAAPAPANLARERAGRGRNRQQQPANAQASNGVVAIVPAPPPFLDDFGWMSPPPVSVHVYTNRAGLPVAAILRVMDAENSGLRFQPIVYGSRGGNEPKWRPVKAADLDGILSRADVKSRPLYGLHDLELHPDRPVVFVSDEAAADSARDKLPGHVIVTALGGKRGFPRADWEPLFDRHVVIWPTAGDSGARDALDLADAIKAARDEWGEARGTTLAVRLPESVRDGWTFADEDVGLDAAAIIETAVKPEDAFTPALVLPRGYSMERDGLYHIAPSRKQDEADTYTQVTTIPFDVVAEVDNSADDDSGLLLTWTGREGYREYVVSRADASSRGHDLMRPLASRGFMYDVKAEMFFRNFIVNTRHRRLVRLVDRSGWHVASSGQRTFVMPGGEMIGPSNAEVLFRAGKGDAAKLAAPYAPSGTLREWQDSIASQADGNDRLILAICAALASPLLVLMEAPGGGFHFWGESSIGKSTLMFIAISVWGSNALKNEWKSTDNATEGMAERASEVGLFLDESTNVRGRIMGDIIYMLANGAGKNRASRDTSVRPTKTFSVFFVSAGEKAVETAIAEDDADITGGQDVRMPSIPADTESGFGVFRNLHGAEPTHNMPAAGVFADTLNDATKRYHGTAGRHFINALAARVQGDDLAEFREGFQRHINAFLNEFIQEGDSPQVVRVAKRFAFAAAVGETAIEAGTLPWAPGTAIWGAGQSFVDWLTARGGAGDRESIQAIKHVRSMLFRHGETRFTPIVRDSDLDKSDLGRIVHDRLGFRQATDGGHNYYIPVRDWDAFCRGVDPKKAADALDAAGALMPADGRNLAKKLRLPGMGPNPIRCYVITPALFQDCGEDDGTPPF